MILINNTKKVFGFWSEKAKAYGHKIGKYNITPGENQVPDDVFAEIAKTPTFKVLDSENKLVPKKDKQAAKELEAQLKAEAEARKAEEAAQKKAEEEARKEEAAAITAMKDALVGMGMERKSLNGKNLKALQAIHANLSKKAE
jgi:hypothetical protein